MTDHHDSTPNYGVGRKTLKTYVIGLVLSLVLTLLAFALVGKEMWSTNTIYITISILALIQLVVQVIFFLRLNTTTEGRWNSMAFIFTLVIILILVAGSLWIMYNLNYNMVH